MARIQTTYNNTPVKAKFEIPQAELPSSARVVIVGGGIAGASIAYHFAKAGWKDVCLLEQNQLSSGTTWHSAGQVGQLRSSSAQTKINRASAELYARLEKEAGHDPGWLQCGGLQLAACEERLCQLQRNAAMAGVFGVEADVISAAQCLEYWPMLNVKDLHGAVYLPGDGRVLPGECTIALAKGAMQGGVQIFEGVSVEGMQYSESANGFKRFSGLKTNRGDIQAEWIVLACNMWMRQLGLSAGVNIPVYPCEHHYVITQPIDGVTRNSPCTRDPDAGIYFRSLDDGGLKLGAFKHRSKPWQINDHVPNDFAFSLLEPDWPDFAEPFQHHLHRLKGLSRNDVVKFVNGPEAFTPDNIFLMGQPHLTDGLFVCGGWNSAGIACAGGAGKYAVEWIENQGMTLDLCAVDIQRFQPFHNERSFLQERVSEVLGLHHQMAWPGREMETGRNRRASSLLGKHKQANACFGESSGSERPRFYAPENTKPRIEYSFVKQNWHDWVAAEVRACRQNVALLDQSTFGKFTLEGRDALDTLQPLCAANLDCEVGRAVYTSMLNRNGTFEADLVVARIRDDFFYIVTSTSQRMKDYDWIARNIPKKARVEFADVTEQFDVVSVMGPKSAEVLYRFNSEVFPLESQPYGTTKDVRMDGLDFRAINVSYVGEPGWELHVPTSSASKLHDALRSFGTTFDMRLIGTEAISSMRIEKGFRAFGHELSPAETPFQAGLTRTIDWDKEFVGKPALEKLKKEKPAKRLVCFRVDDEDVQLWGGEPIYWNDRVAGYTTSACHSPTIGSSIAMGYVRSPSGGEIRENDLNDADFTIEQIGTRYRVQASLRAPLTIPLPSRRTRE